MELRSLQSPTITGVHSALPRTGLREKPFVSGREIRIPNFKGFPDSKRLTLVNFRGQASGTTKVISEVVEAIREDANSKDDNLVFVAGATGRVGSRTVRELLKLGFKVRAGVRSAQRAESLLQSVLQMTLGFENASEGTKPIERLEIVECDLEKRDQIGPALGNASVVICCIGASEKEVFDITGPYRIDYQATKSLIDAATDAKIKHFILLTSLGTNKIGFPAAILNLFWGVLIWKRKAEEALLASGLPYTIVRPGGMERPTDAYKETHNITLSEEDTLFGGQVSNLQVAELMAFMAKNKGLAYCKVVEVIAETTAPLTPLDELLAKVPSQRVEVKPLKESDIATKGQSGVSQSVVPEPLDTPPEKEPAKAKGMTTRPLSPYIVYDDLKPPTSPTPTPSTSAEASSLGDIPAALTSAPLSMQTKSIATEVKKRYPLSPYTKLLVNTVVENTTGVVEIDPSRDITSHQSPYYVYDDLKPPTSPSPNPPNGPLLLSSSLSGGSQMAAMLVNSTAQPLPANKPGDEHLIKPKQNPLSPFTVYEDLKPPASPSSSPRQL